MHSITTDNSSIKSTKQIASFIDLAARLGVDFALIRNKNKTNLHLSFKDEDFYTCEKTLKEMENSISSEKKEKTNDEKVFVEKPICEISKKILEIRDNYKARRRNPSSAQSIIDKTYDVDAVKKLISLREKGNVNEKEISAQSELLGVENFIEAGISNKEILLFLRIATKAIGRSNFINLFRYVKHKYYLPVPKVGSTGGYCRMYQLFVNIGRTIHGTSLETKFLEGEDVNLDFSPDILYRELWCNRSSKNKESFPR